MSINPAPVKPWLAEPWLIGQPATPLNLHQQHIGATRLARRLNELPNLPTAVRVTCLEVLAELSAPC